MTLSLPSEIANTFQIANRFNSARTGSATVESPAPIPRTIHRPIYSETTASWPEPP